MRGATLIILNFVGATIWNSILGELLFKAGTYNLALCVFKNIIKEIKLHSAMPLFCPILF
jgi:hypothetical protein